MVKPQVNAKLKKLIKKACLNKPFFIEKFIEGKVYYIVNRSF